MLAKFTILFAALSLISAMVGPLMARLALIPPMGGMAIFLLSAPLGLAALTAGGVSALRYQAYLPAMVAVLGLLPFLAVVAIVAQGIRYPAINDISTNVENPPTFTHAPTLPANADRDMAFPPDFAAIIKENYSDLAPLPTHLAPEIAYQRARDLAAQDPFNWTITRDDGTSLTFEAVTETRVFKWKDDVIVQAHPKDGGGSLIEMRSKSREGKSDMGANARRIRRYFAALAD